MIVTMKSKDGYDVDVTRLYIDALSKNISIEEYRKELDIIKNTNKNSIEPHRIIK
tara:strand:- start:620 stop:784 length:165 start_codon:yes stop_codon:yes gene_type:complete